MSLTSALSPYLEGPRRYIALGVGIALVVFLGWLAYAPDDGLGDSPVRDVVRAGNKKNVAKLMAFTKDPDINKASEALTQLARVQGKGAREIMEKMLTDPRTEMRLNAARQLGSIGDGNNCKPLCNALKDEDPQVRIAVCKSLAQLRSGQGALAMCDLIEKDSNVQVKQVAVSSVNRAMGVVFRYDMDAAPGIRRVQLGNMRKFAAAVAAASAKQVDISKTN
jgi:HEAT repeat protein